MSNQENPNMNDNNKYLYEKAIEGRQFHMECFNHWMNMYAIINGALFAGLYAVEKTSHILSILVLGCLAGWFWHFSVRGFYRWIISWIKIVSHYEEKLFSNETSGSEHLVYKIFDEESKDKDKKKEKKSTCWEKIKAFFIKIGFSTKYPFSTQKLTRAFTLCIAIVWTVLLAYSIHKISGEDFFIPEITEFLSSWVFRIALGVILIIVSLMATSKIIGLRENLTGNHETFDKAKKKQKYFWSKRIIKTNNTIILKILKRRKN